MPIIQADKPLAPRDHRDFYPTPPGLAVAALRLLPHKDKPFVVDPGAGRGIWGIAMRYLCPHATIWGVDKFFSNKPVEYDKWFVEDFLTLDLYESVDFVIGNPPFRQIESFIAHGYQMLKLSGLMLFLGRLALLEGQRRHKGLWAKYPPMRVIPLSARPSFTGDNKTDATAYALYVWSKSYLGPTTVTFGFAYPKIRFDPESSNVEVIRELTQ